MPVVIEKVVNPSAQDLIDLEKLYKDYPIDLRFADLQALLNKQPAMSLYGARFNDRLLAAITVTPGADGAILDHLCTRALTRQRGVGKELLRQLLKACSETSFIFSPCIESPAINHLFIQAGFSQNGLAFTLQR